MMTALLFLAACPPAQTTDSAKTEATNNKPVADAGSAITQSADNAVALNGGSSRDPDGDVIRFHWSFDHVPEGSLVTSKEAPFSSNDTTSPTTSFIADAVGTYVIKLVVEDAKGAQSDPDFVIITIEDPSTLPIANAGTDLTVNVGQLVILNGSGSYDPQGRAFTYSWTLIDKPTSSAASLGAASTANPTLTPDVKGVYVANLVINNGLASSTGDAVTITALANDSQPVANAGQDIETEDCTTVQLDCSGSADPDGDALTYLWEVQTRPSDSSASNSSFSDRSASRPSFYPDAAGDYTLSCAVFDGTTWSTPDLMKITATDRRANVPPTVNAGANETLDGGTAVCSESGYTYDCDYCSNLTVPLGSTATITDGDGDPYTVVWEVVDGKAEISDPSQLVTSVKLEKAAPSSPGDCDETEYTFKVTATDCTGESDSDTVILIVNCCGVADSN
jgi:hypothetical protein